MRRIVMRHDETGLLSMLPDCVGGFSNLVAPGNRKRCCFALLGVIDIQGALMAF